MSNQTNGQKRSGWKWLAGIVMLGAVAAVLLSRQNRLASGATTTEETMNDQMTVVVFKGDLEKTISSNGNLVPETEANLMFPISGEVAEIEVEVGDVVEKGETLMALDTAALERTVEDAELVVEMRQAEVDALDNDDLRDAEERVADAENALDEAESEDAISIAEVELDIAQAELDSIKNQQSSVNLTVAEAQLAQAENGLEAAESNLENATLTAPFDGIVSQINVDEGGMANGVVLSMFDPDSLVVTLDIDEIDLLELETGTDAALTIDALPGVNLEGNVTHIAVMPTTNMSDRVTYEVDVTLDEHNELLRYGMSTRVRLTTAERDDVLLVPNEAITANNNDGTYFVTVVEGDDNVRAEVEIGIRDREYTEIENGLSRGDEVVVRVNTVSDDSDSGPGLFRE